MGCVAPTNSRKKKFKDDPNKLSNTGEKELNMVYDIGKSLGNGTFGMVYLATNKADKNLTVAIKVIEKTEMDAEDLEALRAEVSILQKVDHPNIVKYYETYDDADRLYLVMEYCEGGELIDVLTAEKTNLEKLTAKTIEKIIRALIHCH